MRFDEVRSKYLEFFRKKGHSILPSSSLVPENDPTTLFTGSGMQPLIPYLLGENHPNGDKIANSQRCLRVEDIEEVGDNRHTTFFEMLGNWSFGSYWKREQLNWVFEFLTAELGILRERLWVTCFEGDEELGLPRDNESARIWEELGIDKKRICFYPSRKNWWSRSGLPKNMPIGEPGGPDSEMFYEFIGIEHNPAISGECHPNCDCGRFMEIGNSVFMEYRKTENGFAKLPRRNVDFGGGIERITSAVNDEPDIFKLDVFAPQISELERSSGKSYNDKKFQRFFRIIADHLRAARAISEDGVFPSNAGQGYVLRRLVRRAILFVDKLGARLPSGFEEEEKRFRKTLSDGMKEFERLSKEAVSGRDAFLLFSTYGFPIDMTIDLAKERGISVDREGFQNELERHREVSRAGAEKKFKGGLADASDMSLKYHTATHLLHQALRDVLGQEVEQKGSNITPERLRFDFKFSRKMSDDEKKRVEEIVNEKISENLSVNKIILNKAEAEKTGALHFFGEKYGEQVNVYYIGSSLDDAYSKEFCGGPHVAKTGELGGGFKILKEETVGTGVRRIKAVLSSK